MAYFHYQSPLGVLTITMVDNEITSIGFGGKPFKKLRLYRECSTKSALSMTSNNGLKKQIEKQLNEYFLGKLKVFDLPLQYKGTPFQMKVWKYLQSISYGKTVSYQEVAQAIGHPKSARAVGTACKCNPIPLIIPCHRIITSSGEIGGYIAGSKTKAWLLTLERKTISTQSLHW